jgi:hypothetical protein
MEDPCSHGLHQHFRATAIYIFVTYTLKPLKPKESITSEVYQFLFTLVLILEVEEALKMSAFYLRTMQFITQEDLIELNHPAVPQWLSANSDSCT